MRNASVLSNSAVNGVGGGIVNSGGSVALSSTRVALNNPDNCAGFFQPGCA